MAKTLFAALIAALASLLVLTGASAGTVVTLIDQTSGPMTASFPSWVGAQTADDFIVPAGETWKIDEVDVVGDPASCDAGLSVTVQIYGDRFIMHGGYVPGTLLYSENVAPGDGLVQTGCDLAIPVASAPSLPPGRHWVSVVASGRWWWEATTWTPANGSWPAYLEPTAYFGPDWVSVGMQFGRNDDMKFVLKNGRADSMGPAITITSPEGGASYDYGASVLAHYGCSDDDSGVATCAGTVPDGAAIDTSTLGSQSFTVSATDNAGNQRSKTVTYSVVDNTPPEIAITTPADDATYTLNQPVLADYGCTDVGGSSVASCTGTVAAGTAIDTSTLGSHSFTVDAADLAGNTASTTYHYTVVDTTAPAITITTPADNASYTLSQTVLADYGCTDIGGSGVATCNGPVTSGTAIDTSTVGSHTFTVDAADVAGNTASTTYHYTVAYAWTGFFQPVDNPPVLNVAKAGSSVPVKFSLGGNRGLGILATGYPKSTIVPCDMSGATDVLESTATAGMSGLNYDATVDQYTYVWKTDKAWAGTCRRLDLKLTDGTTHSALFKFAK